MVEAAESVPEPSQPLFTGVGVALVTLFDEKGAVDGKATADLASRLVDAGMRAVVLAGTTGEAVTLDLEDRRELVSSVRAAIPAGSGVPLLVGSGSASAYQAARFSAAAREDGADAVIVLSPPGSRDLVHYYGAVEQVVEGLPIVGYHYPSASAPGIPVKDLPTLPLMALKDSSGDPERLLETLSAWNGFLYTGSSAMLSFAGSVGCAGAILQLANAEPERCIRAFEGDAKSQRELITAHLAMRAGFPKRIKEMTAARFGTSVVSRL